MPVNLQHLQSLLGVSSLSDVKINDSGKLEKRSGIRALFARIGEFFQSLSAGGRAAIAARNEAVVSAMRQAVNEACIDAQPQAQQISRRLATVTDSLATAMKETRSAAKKDVISKLHDDQRFKALPADFGKNPHRHRRQHARVRLEDTHGYRKKLRLLTS